MILKVDKHPIAVANLNLAQKTVSYLMPTNYYIQMPPHRWISEVTQLPSNDLGSLPLRWFS